MNVFFVVRISSLYSLLVTLAVAKQAEVAGMIVPAKTAATIQEQSRSMGRCCASTGAANAVTTEYAENVMILYEGVTQLEDAVF